MILPILCQFEGLGKQPNEIKFFFFEISNITAEIHKSAVMIPKAHISLRDNPKSYTFQLLAAQTFTLLKAALNFKIMYALILSQSEPEPTKFARVWFVA